MYCSFIDKVNKRKKITAILCKTYELTLRRRQTATCEFNITARTEHCCGSCATAALLRRSGPWYSARATTAMRPCALLFNALLWAHQCWRGGSGSMPTYPVLLLFNTNTSFTFV